MKRVLDFIFSALLILMLIPIFIIIVIIIKLTTTDSPIFKQQRVGKDNKVFVIYKFRTMKANTPNVATYLLKNPNDYLTFIGKILRKTSLDELPQLMNILKGDMSFVGPRPVISEEKELIRLRTDAGVHKLVPGLTGWAQVNGRDALMMHDKVRYDKYYLDNQSLWLDIYIVIITFYKVLKNEGVIEGNKVPEALVQKNNIKID
ncbi:sugar transferase [Clostridium oryzae]|uniref:Undecaprenyl phosphate N,N'-diacetylbacillosamine 1-phosphate transferase n=1 Tax=Clostridium oryzae TaxID=1450648 RepID=A0A1V4IP13_9CLOT|nr:sugar transferase [Clostridium oryzae]OPJ61646.1 undecaprenyl phosphate N,N'-diacetylbacillosamine 1-phosphate transferase [Clostridium oryzae]